MTPESLAAIAILIPLAGAGLVAVSGRRAELRDAAVLATAVALFLTVAALVPLVLDGARPRVVLLEILPGLTLSLMVEPLGALFGLVAAGLWVATTVYSFGYLRANRERHRTRFHVCFALALAATLGVAFSGNLLTLFVFYEVLTLVTWPLVSHHGTPGAARAGRVYLGLLLGTSVSLQLLAILWTWQVAGTLEFTPGGILSGHLEGPGVTVLLLLYAFGIGKLALMPLHRWLPAAMVAPTPVSALLHAVAVVKAGAFTLVKVVVYVFGVDFLAASGAGTVLLYVAAVSVIAASLVALRQDNLKRRLAYSTISQLAYVVLATAVLAPLSVLAAALHIAAHACGKITLFFAAGSIYTASHKTRVSELDGIGRRMPWTLGAFAIGALSQIGVPPTVGFLSKWYLLQGALQSQQTLVVAVIVLSTLLNAGYYLPILHAAFFRPDPADAAHGESPVPMVTALAATAALTVLLFFAPEPFLQLARALPAAPP